MGNYTIKDLENLSGIKAHTIRIWEKRYNLVQPSRTSTNIRFYDDNDLKKILNISILNRHGVKISRIANMCEDEVREKITLLTRDANDSNSQIEKLIVSMLELDEDKFDNILSRSVMQIGFEETFTTILYPFFNKVGLMWQTGTINPSQEHFISNLVRQKLIVAIDSQVNRKRPDGKKFLLFLPEGELHELGLLYFSYILKRRGHEVIYLGQSVPLNDLENIQRIRKSDFFITTFFNVHTKEKIDNFVEKVSRTFPEITTLITGGYPKEVIKKHSKNIVLLRDPKEFMSFLDLITSN